MLKHILRWIAYVPSVLLAIAIVQAVTNTFAERFPWWIVMPFMLTLGYSLFAIPIVAAGFICPNRKTGNLLMLAFFVLCESIAFAGEIATNTALENIVRSSVDIMIAIALCGAAFTQNPPSFNGKSS